MPQQDPIRPRAPSTTAQDPTLAELRDRVAELEARLAIPDKITLSKQAAASGEARKNVLQLPDTAASSDLTGSIASLADKNNVIVEWTAHDLKTAAASGCCCCCCCCHD